MGFSGRRSKRSGPGVLVRHPALRREHRMIGRVNLLTDNRSVCLCDNGADAFGLTWRKGTRNLASAFQRHHQITGHQPLYRAIGAIGHKDRRALRHANERDLRALPIQDRLVVLQVPERNGRAGRKRP